MPNLCPGPMVRGIHRCEDVVYCCWVTAIHSTLPKTSDRFCYNQKKPFAMQVKTSRINLGREQGCLDAEAGTAFAGRSVTSAALFSRFNEEAEAKRLLGGWEGRHQSGKSFERFRPATEMYLTIRYETPAFLSPPPPLFN